MSLENFNKDSGLEREFEDDSAADTSPFQHESAAETSSTQLRFHPGTDTKPDEEPTMLPTPNPVPPVSTAEETFTLHLSPELSRVLTSLARIANLDEGDVLRQAIVLMGVAVEARREGLKFGIVDRDQKLVTEIVGL